MRKTSEIFPSGRVRLGILRRLEVVRASARERGATAVEYGLLVGLIAVVIIVAVTALGGKLTALFASIAAKLPAAA